MRSAFNQHLANDYSVLRRYMGEIRFNALAMECIAGVGPGLSNVRSQCANLPELIAAGGKSRAELAELAMLERAMTAAFSSHDAGVLSRRQFEQLAADAVRQLRLELHPSVWLLSFTQNTLGIWSSLMCDEPPPRPFRLDAPQHVLVWRQGERARMRMLGEEECFAVEIVKAGASFEKLSDTLAKYDSGDHPQANTLTYVRGWLDSGVLADTSIGVVK